MKIEVSSFGALQVKLQGTKILPHVTHKIANTIMPADYRQNATLSLLHSTTITSCCTLHLKKRSEFSSTNEYNPKTITPSLERIESQMNPIRPINASLPCYTLPTQSASSIKSDSTIVITSKASTLILICDAWRNRRGNSGTLLLWIHIVKASSSMERRYVLGIPGTHETDYNPVQHP